MDPRARTNRNSTGTSVCELDRNRQPVNFPCMNTFGRCKLCLREDRKLIFGHVTPRFVFKRLVDDDNGTIRNPVQVRDGIISQMASQPRSYMLCQDCEQEISTREHRVSHFCYTSDGSAVPVHLLGIDPTQIHHLVQDISEPDTPDTQKTEEDLIVAYVKQHGSISNTECRQLLSVDRRRASYLLDKMYTADLLTRQGSHRWVRYALPYTD